MEKLLAVVSGLAWTVVYVDSIRVGFRQRTYAIPVAALALNFAWETINGVYGLSGGVSVQAVVNVVWAVLDAVIVVTFLRFGRSEFPAFVSRGMFVIGTLGLFAVAYAVQLSFVLHFGWNRGAEYAAFLQNLLMSGLFIAMFLARRGPRGQTLTIAVAKCVGTLAATIGFGVVRPNGFIVAIGLLCLLLDLAYITLMVWGRRLPSGRSAPRGTPREDEG